MVLTIRGRSLERFIGGSTRDWLGGEFVIVDVTVVDVVVTTANDSSRVLVLLPILMDRLDRVIVIGAATAEAITPNDDEADPSPSLQMFNRNTKIVDATTNIIIVRLCAVD